MSASTVSTRGGFGRRAKMLILGAMLACLGVFAFSGSAKAAPFSMDLTNGQLNLGVIKDAEILPAPDRIPADNATPNLPDLWQARDTTEFANPLNAAGFGCLTPVNFNFSVSPPTPTATPNPAFPCGPNPDTATVSGDLTGGAVTVQGTARPESPANKWGLPNGFRFPTMFVLVPLIGVVPVSVASQGNLTGTYDAGTGDLELNGPIEARFLTGLTTGLPTSPLGSYCALPLEGLTLSTTSNADFPGVPFDQGIAGPGALTGTYNITEDATSVGGADCATVSLAGFSKGPGSVWVSAGIPEPPVCPEFTTGIPPDCEPIPCPEGFEGNEPDCVKLQAKITKVTVKGPSKVKKGRKATYKVRIKNSGNAKATGVRIKVKGRGVSFSTSVGKIGAKKTRTVKVRLKARKPGKVRVSFKVTSKNAGGKTVKKTIRVRK